jgi:hypothetical protein
VLVQRRSTHSRLCGDRVDAEGLAVVALDPADSAIDLLQLAFGERDLPQLRGLLVEK